MQSAVKICLKFGAVICALAISCVSAVGAAEFPEKPIQVLVGWPAGSLNDMVDRAIAQVLQKILKQPVIVQNVPGGGGALVLGRIKTEKPDGYTIFQTGSPMYSRTPHTRNVNYDALKDFAFLAQDSWFQFFLEDRGDAPWKNFDEMIAYVKKNPKKVKYTTSGVGTSQHLMMEYIGMRENLQWIHVPFTGSNECVAALLGGHVDMHSGTLGGRTRPYQERPTAHHPRREQLAAAAVPGCADDTGKGLRLLGQERPHLDRAGGDAQGHPAQARGSLVAGVQGPDRDRGFQAMGSGSRVIECRSARENDPDRLCDE